VTGTAFALVDGSPVEAIVFAQAANALVLPFIAVFLLVVMNRRDLLGEHRSTIGGNLAGGAVVLIVSGLGIVNLITAFTG
jgi:manganese transport protein